MNKLICEKVSILRQRLRYHAYCVETNTEYEIESLIKSLDLALGREKLPSSPIPDVTSSFQDVIETLHQIDQLLLYEGQDEIDRDFFGTGVHLPISFDVSVITKSLLDCYHRFKLRGTNSELLVLYAWLLGEAWYRILCQDTLDLWSSVINEIHLKIQYVDEALYSQLLECIPPEMR